METEHVFNYDNFKILTTENNLEKLKILEMLYINNQNTVNIKTDVDGLNIQYISILNKLKQSWNWQLVQNDFTKIDGQARSDPDLKRKYSFFTYIFF